ncbi:MAG: hypothetical protein JWO31_1121 [Phycisphaerales bacterium]|nr:hypothetical protein [Phycisphaerales bacterium]
MRGSQSAPSEPTTPGRTRRRFTVAEANRALPLVGRIAADVVRAHADAVAAQDRLAAAAAAADKAALQDRLRAALERLEDFVDELTEVGCDLKDGARGLVDFTGRHDGRDVCLCWQLGEDRVDHWHETDAGFAGRQPIESLREG